MKRRILKFFGLVSLKEHEAILKEEKEVSSKLRKELREVCCHPDSLESMLIINSHKMERDFSRAIYFGDARFRPLGGEFVNVNEGQP